MLTIVAMTKDQEITTKIDIRKETLIINRIINTEDINVSKDGRTTVLGNNS
jgi:hypothetical protein